MQNDWAEGYRLSTIIQFQFPECPKVEINAIVTRAGGPGLQLLDDFLRWDPERRPTAQQALKYPYFQMVKSIQSQNQRVSSNTATVITAATNAAPINLITESQNHNGINGRISNVSFASYGDVGGGGGGGNGGGGGGGGANENQLKIENTKNLVSTTTNTNQQHASIVQTNGSMMHNQQPPPQHQNGEKQLILVQNQYIYYKSISTSISVIK